jgi:hypothetical protein
MFNTPLKLSSSHAELHTSTCLLGGYCISAGLGVYNLIVNPRSAVLYLINHPFEPQEKEGVAGLDMRTMPQ